jgi:hypothetical protein
MPDNVRALGSTRDAIREFFAAERRNSEKIEKYNRGLTEDEELPPYVHQEYPKAMYPLGYPQEEPVVANDLREEQQRMAAGYYPSLGAQQEAREAFEAQLAQPDEMDEEESMSVPSRGEGGRVRKKTA